MPAPDEAQDETPMALAICILFSAEPDRPDEIVVTIIVPTRPIWK